MRTFATISAELATARAAVKTLETELSGCQKPLIRVRSEDGREVMVEVHRITDLHIVAGFPGNNPREAYFLKDGTSTARWNGTIDADDLKKLLGCAT